MTQPQQPAAPNLELGTVRAAQQYQRWAALATSWDGAYGDHMLVLEAIHRSRGEASPAWTAYRRIQDAIAAALARPWIPERGDSPVKPPLTPLTPAALDALKAEQRQLQQELAELLAAQQNQRWMTLAQDWYGAYSDHLLVLSALTAQGGEGSPAWAAYVRLQTASMHAIRMSGMFTNQGSDR